MKTVQNALDAYIHATNSHKFEHVAKLLSNHAVYMFTNKSWIGKDQIQTYFEGSWKAIEDEVYTIEDITWLASNENSAICIFVYQWKGYINGESKEGTGQGTNVFVNENGEWKLIHEHLSPLA
ncbi:MAG TPA: nuclear transport factor 2 family protein [Pseudoneobacillus sp.]|nr:nuclear transport factor 2 family protein [Pseudoneobacillus sp.]